MDGVECTSKIEFEDVGKEGRTTPDGTGFYYCRLCADLKPTDKFINLLVDDGARDDIVRKLRRINAPVDFASEILPLTVCIVCLTTLNTAYDFVFNIERAQATLSTNLLGKHIKVEVEEDSSSSPSSDDDNDSVDTPDSAEDVKTIKKEKEDVKPPRKSLKKLQDKKAKRNRQKFIPHETWKDYSWLCTFCETQFPTIGELRKHSMEVHDTCNPYRCTECRIRKLALDNFLVHVKRHRKDLKYSCYVCCAKFMTLSEARSHKSKHLKTEFVCGGCNHTFRNSADLEKHTNTYYKSLKPKKFPLMQHTSDLTCLICKKKYACKSTLQNHLLTHTDRKRDHTCEICGKCFFTKKMLTEHIILHNNARPHQCEICKASFKTYPLLKGHIKTHDSNKPFECEQCGRCFRTLKQMQSHATMHTDLAPYTCSFCNKAFRLKSAMNQHVRQHTGVKPYSCTICHRDFTNWGNCNKHMKRRHGIDTAKKKRTAEGMFPINPMTGEVLIPETTQDILEWKRNALLPRKPHRPKRNIPPGMNLGQSANTNVSMASSVSIGSNVGMGSNVNMGSNVSMASNISMGSSISMESSVSVGSNISGGDNVGNLNVHVPTAPQPTDNFKCE